MIYMKPVEPPNFNPLWALLGVGIYFHGILEQFVNQILKATIALVGTFVFYNTLNPFAGNNSLFHL